MSITGDVRIAAPFLDAEAVAAVLADRQRAFAATPAEDRTIRVAMLAWTLGEERYATPLTDIVEVAPVPRVTRVPGAPAALAGVVAWRGAVLNLFDPVAALGSHAPAEGGRIMLILRHLQPRVALRITAALSIVQAAGMEDSAAATLTRFSEVAGGERLVTVDTAMLIERLLARSPQQEG